MILCVGRGHYFVLVEASINLHAPLLLPYLCTCMLTLDTVRLLVLDADTMYVSACITGLFKCACISMYLQLLGTPEAGSLI